jgi:hypothetical protein
MVISLPVCGLCRTDPPDRPDVTSTPGQQGDGQRGETDGGTEDAADKGHESLLGHGE